MGIGTSIFLIAVGAILKWGVTTAVAGVSIHTIGVILMVVGVIGLLISLFMVTLWTDRTRDRPLVRDRVVEREPLP